MVRSPTDLGPARPELVVRDELCPRRLVMAGRPRSHHPGRQGSRLSAKKTEPPRTRGLTPSRLCAYRGFIPSS